MLRAFRVARAEQYCPATVGVYRDEDLVDISFDFQEAGARVRDRRLTKLRSFRRSGASMSLELRGGLVLGIELLGFRDDRWNVVVPTFSEEIETEDEIPLLGLELDGANTDAEVSIMTIDQATEFLTRWAERQSELEVSFGQHHRASRAGPVLFLFDRDERLSGIRVRL